MYFIVGISLPLFSLGTIPTPEPKGRIKFIKQKPESVNGILGIAYITDKSRHPV